MSRTAFGSSRPGPTVYCPPAAQSARRKSLTTADRFTFYKMMTSQVAKRFGAIATHMPKPFARLTGSGCHFHISLWDREKRYHGGHLEIPAVIGAFAAGPCAYT